jgi:hypothetical protein
MIYVHTFFGKWLNVINQTWAHFSHSFVDEAHITLVPSSISQAEKGRSFGIGMALKELEPLAAGEVTRVWGMLGIYPAW